MSWACAPPPAGPELLTLDNGILEVTLAAGLGGKVIGIHDRRNGREWLWTSERAAHARHAYCSSYTALADSGGWDECLPTVAPCVYPLEPWGGTPLPDHGELWSQSGETRPIEEADWVGATTVIEGVVLPYRFERTLRLARGAPRLEFDYRLVSLADDDLAFIWCAHPLLCIERGMRLRFPHATHFNLYGAPIGGELSGTAGLTWPVTVLRDGAGVDLEPLPDHTAAFAVKLWSDPLTAGWAELHARDGLLRFEFPGATVRRVALWLNLGGWSGDGGPPHYNLGLEPCIGAQDSLEEAVLAHHAYRTLPGRGRETWSLRLLVMAGLDTGSTNAH